MPPRSPLVCRICLSVDVTMYKIADTPLQRVFEKITSYSLVTSDRRPVLACYVCCARLHASRKLMLTAARADLAFTTILDKSAKVTKKAVCSLDRKALGLCSSLVFSRPECVEFQPLNQVSPHKTDPPDNLHEMKVIDKPENTAEDESADELEDGEFVLREESKILEADLEEVKSEIASEVKEEIEDANGFEFVAPVASPQEDNSQWETDDNTALRDSVTIDQLTLPATQTAEKELQGNEEEFEQAILSSLNKEHPETVSSSDEYQPSDDSDGYMSDCLEISRDQTVADVTIGNKSQDTNGNNLIDAMPSISKAEHDFNMLKRDDLTKDNLFEDVLSSNVGQSTNNSVKRVRNRTYCIYCKTLVLNFARHVTRRHYDEFEVQKILALSKNSKTRRNLFVNLQKKGNYISNLIRCERPMRLRKGLKQSDYLPCQSCLGFYARKHLWKHKKQCCPEQSSKNTQAEAQNLMCFNTLNSSHTPSKPLENVFCRMHADHISFVAKRDPMICEFGENYLKKHRQDDFVTNETSRKMRELSKLFIEVRKKKPEIETFFDALKPQNYDALVAATKVVAKYDVNSDRLNSPTYAMNISSSIKQCCNIAIKAILKTDVSRKAVKIQAELRALIQIIESRWKFDVSSKAADDLIIKKCTKVPIIPLARDLKLLKDHLSITAQNATRLTEVENCQHMAAYNELVETVFCRVLLLNRRRTGELQRLPLSSYTDNKKQDLQNEEFDCLSASEKFLMKRFTNIVIGDERSREVPVFFSTDAKRDLDLLISLRNKYIDADNKFLFARPAGMTNLHGYKVLQKHVKLSGAKHPEAICSTKFRKHVATLTQLFNMTEDDIEQLTNFIDHTTVHRTYCNLPDEIARTAKIAKLILMEDDKADKEKNLDEINSTPDDPKFVTLTDTNKTKSVTDPDTNEKSKEPSVDVTDTPRPGKKRILVPWTTEQKNVVINHFKTHINAKKALKRHECEALKALHPELLHNKDWLKIKVFIQNAYSKK